MTLPGLDIDLPAKPPSLGDDIKALAKAIMNLKLYPPAQTRRYARELDDLNMHLAGIVEKAQQ